jgi:mRNA interferase RelE/StbE
LLKWGRALAWLIKLSKTAEKQLEKLDKPVAQRIYDFLETRVAVLGDPRSIGAALTGSRFGELWKYRQGDYRIVARIEDDVLQILVVQVGHRKEVYR